MPEKVFFTAPLSHASVPLWRCAFGEEEGEIRRLLDLLSPDATLLCAEENGERVFQGVLIPLSLGGQTGYYLYALATAPSRRRQGYMRAALEAARRLAKRNGLDFLLLIPASEGLADAYRRLGFCCELPLSASPDGREGYLSLPKEADELPFCGDEETLYPSSPRHLPLSAFRAMLFSFSDAGDLFLTRGGGYRMRSRKDPDLCLFADARTMEAARRSAAAHALLYPLHDTHLPPDTMADPLPR